MATASRYSFVDGAKLPANADKGQLGLCVRHLRTLGSATAEELAAAIKDELVTVQTPERIAAYYLCVLKKAGSVRATDATAPRTAEDIRAEIDRLGKRMDELDAELAAILEA
jgi:hypothetical protein